MEKSCTAQRVYENLAIYLKNTCSYAVCGAGFCPSTMSLTFSTVLPVFFLLVAFSTTVTVTQGHPVDYLLNQRESFLVQQCDLVFRQRYHQEPDSIDSLFYFLGIVLSGRSHGVGQVRGFHVFVRTKPSSYTGPP